MPIYEYQCEKCHHHLEALQKIADKPLRECPECGRHALKRLVSAPLFRLAGSGWYETDFKSDKETRRNLAGREEATATEGSKASSGTSETKTDQAAKPAKEPSMTRPAAKVGGAKTGTSTKKAAKKPAARKSSGKR
jgi:putative FmdB family regulatory protein